MLEDLLSLPITALARILPPDLAEALLRLSLRDRVFLMVAAAIVVLMAISLLFAAMTFLHRLRTERHEEQVARIIATHQDDLLRVLAGELEPEVLNRRIRPGDRIEFVAWLMEFAERVRGVELERIRELAHPHLHLIADRLFVPSAERRARAVLILGALGVEDHEEAIVQALDDPTPMVSLMAAEALAAKGGARYAGPILERIHRFDLWSSAYLAEMLSSMGPEVVPDLTAVFENPQEEPSVRAVAADALAQIGAPESGDSAYRVLERLRANEREGGGTEGRRELVLSSLRVLERYGRPEHGDIPRRLLDHSDPVVRALAASAVGALGADDDVPLLVAALSDDSRWVALHAARGLRSLRAVETLEALASERDPRADLCREVLAE